MKTALIIFNSKKTYNYFFRDIKKIVHTLNNNNYKVEIYSTQSSGDCTVYLDNNRDFDLIVTSGGDGTMHETTNGIKNWKKKPKILYFPSGTVNDMASTLKIKSDTDYILQLFENDLTTIIDSANFNDHKFNYVAAFGTFTSSSYLASNTQKNSLGSIAYIMEGILSLKEINNTVRLKAIIDDNEEIEGEFLIGLITNSTSVAGIRKLFKNNNLHDGTYNLLLLPKANFENLISMPYVLVNGISNDLLLKNAIYRQFSKLNIISDTKIKWSLDGEEGPVGNAIISVNNSDLEIYSELIN